MARGGPRPGAGRPRKYPALPADLGLAARRSRLTPEQFLLGLLRHEGVDPTLRLQAARLLLPRFFEPPMKPVRRLGKKAQAELDAQSAAVGTSWEEILKRP